MSDLHFERDGEQVTLYEAGLKAQAQRLLRLALEHSTNDRFWDALVATRHAGNLIAYVAGVSLPEILIHEALEASGYNADRRRDDEALHHHRTVTALCNELRGSNPAPKKEVP